MFYPTRAVVYALVMGAALLALAACVTSGGEKEESEALQVQPADPTPTDAQPPDAPTQVGATSTPFFTTPKELQDEEPPPGAIYEFSTKFSLHSVSYKEIISGGPPKDGIPAIDSPKFETVEEADEWLEDLEPVILFENNGEARAYPIQILVWHEIVNDTVGDEPVVITFCPLCNTAIAFSRRIDKVVVTFGTTGRLRFSNLIMYDRLTNSWWQQANGEAIAGTLTGKQLEFKNAPIIAWEDFKASYPEGQVLSRDTGHDRSYGRNPYSGYDNINSSPFLYYGPETPGTLPPIARVLTVELNDEAVAYPYSVLEEEHVVNDTVGGEEVVAIWEAGTGTPFEGAVAGRDVGAAALYSRELNGQTLTLSWNGQNVVDDQTGSAWNVLGRAISGELEGEQLTPVVAVNHFWFSWAAFMPETRVYFPEEE